jgi:DNA-binding CsgD family transcriptional regulator
MIPSAAKTGLLMNTGVIDAFSAGRLFLLTPQSTNRKLQIGSAGHRSNLRRLLAEVVCCVETPLRLVSMDKTNHRNLMNAVLVGKELLAARTFRELNDLVSTYLLHLLNAEGSILALLKNGGIDLGSSEHTGLCSKDREKEYFEYYYRLDPFMQSPMTPYSFSVYVTDDVVEGRDMPRYREYYEEFLKPMSIWSHLFINLGFSGGHKGILVAARSLRLPSFSSADKSLALLMEPFLSSALERILLTDENLWQESLIRTLVQRDPTKAIVVLNNVFELVHKNENAQAILSMLYRCDESRVALPSCLLEGLRKHFGDMSGPPTGQVGDPSSFEVLSPVSRQRVRVSMYPVSHMGKIPHVLVFMSLLDGNQLFVSKNRFGLTEREAEIASLMCQGLRNGDVAKKLFISEYTVGNHVKHIFEKLGINSRTGLIQYIVGLQDPEPPLLPTDEAEHA